MKGAEVWRIPSSLPVASRARNNIRVEAGDTGLYRVEEVRLSGENGTVGRLLRTALRGPISFSCLSAPAVASEAERRKTRDCSSLNNHKEAVDRVFFSFLVVVVVVVLNERRKTEMGQKLTSSPGNSSPDRRSFRSSTNKFVGQRLTGQKVIRQKLNELKFAEVAHQKDARRTKLHQTKGHRTRAPRTKARRTEAQRGKKTKQKTRKKRKGGQKFESMKISCYTCQALLTC